MAQQYTVILTSANTPYTGSIARVQAVGRGASAIATTGSLTVVNFGDPKENSQNPLTYNNWTPTSTISQISIPVGDVIEGPIGSLRTEDGDDKTAFLIYYTK